MTSYLELNPLVKWFLSQKRELPWRSSEKPSSYAVWVSEIMLQQTQVKVVIPYFEAWMKKFPTIQSLAEASEADVIKAWEGLGYYSRARRLHQGAIQCMKDFNGELPQEAELLLSIKGIGPYTLGALLSFAFHKRAAAVDGNVMRVISRLTADARDITSQSTKKAYEEIVLKILPQDKPWRAMEALIELGALICAKKPNCRECPLRQQCQGFLQGKTELLPIKKKAPETTYLNRPTLILVSTCQKVLIKKNLPGQIMEDLWEFPYFNQFLPETFWGYSLKDTLQLKTISHSFTRYQVKLHPHLLKVDECTHVEGYEWIELNRINDLPFSSGHKRLLAYL